MCQQVDSGIQPRRLSGKWDLYRRRFGALWSRRFAIPASDRYRHGKWIVPTFLLLHQSFLLFVGQWFHLGRCRTPGQRLVRNPSSRNTHEGISDTNSFPMDAWHNIYTLTIAVATWVAFCRSELAPLVTPSSPYTVTCIPLVHIEYGCRKYATY